MAQLTVFVSVSFSVYCAVLVLESTTNYKFKMEPIFETYSLSAAESARVRLRVRESTIAD
jgi:hypothetical protein